MKTNIGIIVALEIEASYLLKIAGVKNKRTYNNYSFYELNTRKGLAIVAISGVGCLRVKECLKTMLSLYEIDVIIHYGIAGALNDSLLPNTVIFADEVLYYDVISDEYSNHKIKLDNDYKSHALLCFNDAVLGQIISVNRFISLPQKEKIKNINKSALCVDMESYAVALLSQECSIPLVVIRCISDNADGKIDYKCESFGEDASRHLSEGINNVIDGLLE